MSDSKWSDRPDQQAAPARSGISLWIFLGLAVAVAIAVRYFTPPRATEGRGAKHPAIGTKLTVLSLQPLTVEGPPITPADLAGKVTLINFWGTWCPPCAIEFPHLVEIEQHFRGRPGFQFVSVSSSGGRGDDANIASDTAQFLAQQQATFPTYRDAGAVTRDYLDEVAKLGGFAFPTTAVIGRDGTIRGFWAGYVRGDEREVQEIVERELAGPSK